MSDSHLAYTKIWRDFMSAHHAENIFMFFYIVSGQVLSDGPPGMARWLVEMLNERVHREVAGKGRVVDVATMEWTTETPPLEVDGRPTGFREGDRVIRVTGQAW